MARNPKEQWERLQLMLQHRGGRGGFGFGGGFPSGGGRGGGVGVAMLVLAIGGYALSNSLFNGEANYIPCAWMIPGRFD
jgi:prohibitin 2